MINVKTKIKCLEKNCLKQPCYNFDSETKGIQCTQHKLKDMVDVKTKRKCLEDNC